MAPVPDENDLIYERVGIDIVGLARSFFDWISAGNGESVLSFLAWLWNVYSVIAIILSFLFIAGFIYAKIRYAQLVEIENQHIREAEEAWAHAYGGEASKNTRFEEIQAHIKSENPNDWRLAIIEADIILEEMLTDAGYIGDTIGDKLKTANPASFTTLQDAWDAHKIRNQIAHSADFVLTRRLAEEAIVKYERVFREFGVI